MSASVKEKGTGIEIEIVIETEIESGIGKLKGKENEKEIGREIEKRRLKYVIGIESVNAIVIEEIEATETETKKIKTVLKRWTREIDTMYMSRMISIP